MALFFEVVSSCILWAVFWAQKKELLKLKSNSDFFLEASWDPLGTILADLWSIFGNFLGTCLASRFDIDF